MPARPRKPRTPKPEAPTKQQTEAERIAREVKWALFPFEVRRTDLGMLAVIEKWSLSKGEIMTEQITALFTKMVMAGQAGKDAAPEELGQRMVRIAFAELKPVIRESTRSPNGDWWTDADLERLSYEDFLDLAGMLVRVCLAARPGEEADGGVLGKLPAFLAEWVTPLRGMAASFSAPSLSSSEPDTAPKPSSTDTAQSS